MFLRSVVALLVCALASSAGENLYRIQNFAGSDFAGDGEPAVQAPLIQPQGLAVDRDGTLVFADAGDHRVRRVIPNGTISTIIGDGLPGSGDRLKNPYGVAIGPKREIYVADLGNGRVVRIDPDGKRHEIQGFQQPRNVAVDPNGVLYVSDFGANRVYRVKSDDSLELATTEVLKGPAGLIVDATGTLYVADSGNQRVVRVKAGVAQSVLTDFGAVTSIALDGSGRLYVAGGDRVAVVAPSGSIMILQSPADEVALDMYGSLLMVAYRQVRSYRLGTTTILAGNGSGSYAGDDKPKEQWRFLRPSATIRDADGVLYIADSGNGRIRRIDAEGKLSTLMAGLGNPTALALDSKQRLYFSDSKTGLVHRVELDGTSKAFSRGSGINPFSRPSGLAFGAMDDLYVADTGNGMLRKVTSDGFVSIIAGGGSSDKDGFAMSVRLTNPVGIAVGSDRSVWFTEPERLRRLSPDGRITTVPNLPLVDARALHFEDDTHLLVVDAGSNRILRVSIEDGTWEPIAGSGERGYSGDGGLALQATLDSPVDVWPEPDGSLLVCDSGNNRIRLLDRQSGTVEPPPAMTDAPAFTAPIRNGDGTLNSTENPVSRIGSIVVKLTDDGSSSPDVVAEITGIALPVISVTRSEGELTVTLQMPGGFLPSGSAVLDVWVNGVKLEESATVVIR